MHFMEREKRAPAAYALGSKQHNNPKMFFMEKKSHAAYALALKTKKTKRCSPTYAFHEEKKGACGIRAGFKKYPMEKKRLRRMHWLQQKETYKTIFCTPENIEWKPKKNACGVRTGRKKIN